MLTIVKVGGTSGAVLVSSCAAAIQPPAEVSPLALSLSPAGNLAAAHLEQPISHHAIPPLHLFSTAVAGAGPAPHASPFGIFHVNASAPLRGVGVGGGGGDGIDDGFAAEHGATTEGLTKALDAALGAAPRPSVRLVALRHPLYGARKPSERGRRGHRGLSGLRGGGGCGGLASPAEDWAAFDEPETPSRRLVEVGRFGFALRPV